MQSKLISLQFALFFKNVIERPDISFDDLNKKMLNIFDAIPSTFPIPRELPPDIPVITHRSTKNDYVCNIARSRIDLILQRIDDESSNAALLKDFNAKVSAFVKYVLKKQSTTRFGMIARYFHSDQDALGCLKRKYFNLNLDNISELSIRYNQNTESNGFIINDIIELSAAEAIIGGVPQKGIAIQRDINNTPVQDRTLDYQQLLKLSEEYAPQLSEHNVEGLIK